MDVFPAGADHNADVEPAEARPLVQPAVPEEEKKEPDAPGCDPHIASMTRAQLQVMLRAMGEDLSRVAYHSNKQLRENAAAAEDEQLDEHDLLAPIRRAAEAGYGQEELRESGNALFEQYGNRAKAVLLEAANQAIGDDGVRPADAMYFD